MFRAIEQSYVEPVPRKRLTARNDAPEVDIEIKIDIVNTRVIEWFDVEIWIKHSKYNGYAKYIEIYKNSKYNKYTKYMFIIHV